MRVTLSLGAICVYGFLTVSSAFAQGNAPLKPIPKPTPRAAAATAEAEAMILMSGNEWVDARNKVMSLNSPDMVKLYEWMLYRENYDTLPFQRIASFIEKNPHWPNQSALRKSAERNMPSSMPADQIMAWFSKYPPLTGRGAILLTTASQKTKHTQIAGELMKKSWPDLDMSDKDTKSLWTYWQNYIPKNQHIARLDKLLFDHKYTLARSYASTLGQGYPQLAEARIALAENKPNVNALIAKIPAALSRDTGLQYERLSWRRRNNENNGAREILSKQPSLADAPNANEWWKERHIMIRRAIEDRDFKSAYVLATHHGQTDKANKAEAEWLAGWLALRFLNQPQVALGHFNTMYDSVATAISRTRGAYWAGRAEEQMGQKDRALNWYKIAASYPHTYYGQLATRKTGKTASLPPAPVPTEQDRAKISTSDLLHAIQVAKMARLDSIHSQLTSALIATLSTPGEFEEAARVLYASGDLAAGFRVAKSASWKNIILGRHAFPSREQNMRKTNGNHALYHAIIRQESQFDTEARSPAGALGLMQLMPATAKETANKLGIAHQTSWLTENPEHNIILGATYIDTLTGRFANGLPMAIAGYNAGPSRVSGWISEFGDPRIKNAGNYDQDVWVDWIELIPIAETRNYVQRVMENYEIYAHMSR
ncbi:MAG: lytic transglycosylase domain-containing protein [Pseudobdellovibrionaceae bacterium]|nr:lytic transglycosylase domain-containing protein [Pseudobdellovibrionaceae bacterium]